MLSPANREKFKRTLIIFGFVIKSLVIINLCFATAFNFETEYRAEYEYFPNFHYFSGPICGLGTILCLLCFFIKRGNQEPHFKLLHIAPFIIIATGTLTSGSITYTGEDSPSFWVVLLVTASVFPFFLFLLYRLRKTALIACFFLLYSPTLAYYSAHQWVIWNTNLFSDQIEKIEGWNFEVNEWKWFDLELTEKEDVIVYNWVPFFRRFAIRDSQIESHGKGRDADVLYKVDRVNGKLVITQATHVKWNSSGETGVWPSR